MRQYMAPNSRKRVRTKGPMSPQIGTEVVDGQQFMYESQSEHQFMQHVLAYAERQGWADPKLPGMTKVELANRFRPYHTHIAKRSAVGFPDLTMVRAGRLVIAELKREKGGRVGVVQQRWIDELSAVAARICELQGRACCPTSSCILTACIWRPSDWPDIEEVLR